ncbi:hypothetical protein [Chryseobacterium oncorhynchi]|uniref:Chromosomal replication initiator DnaA C-terminal domain-containing protein n=1 Tax=Chryseobacterium oncorhynchi TaxID=741074 RepID=A0A316WF77_9FLAO|nr:hypothetical protein [Chryseobacterium oncorhynchi]PWN60037.1 hypothetical protein C1638_020945 [Chryseobacterium oncorhynchi]
MNSLSQSINIEKQLADKKDKYVEIFKLHYPDNQITEKSYDITLIRVLIMYFLYQEKKVNKIKGANFETIASFFEVRHTTVVRAVEKVNSYIQTLEDERFKSKIGTVKHLKDFNLYYYIFQNIFLNYKCSA